MNKLNKYVSAFLLLTLIIAPSFALAKNEKKNNANQNQNKVTQQNREREQENEVEDSNKTENGSSTKKCFQAWGHLIAPGWIKWNGNTTVPDNCIMPFGIGKKFKGDRNGNATSTPDTKAPIINNLVVTPNRYSTSITWKTDELSDSKVFYSTTSPVDLTSSTIVTSSVFTKNHTINISGLASSTTYYAIVTSKDPSGNTATSSQVSFTTLPPIADTVPPVISNVIATVGTTTVNFGWKTNELSTSKVYYSTSSPVNLSTSTIVENNTLTTNHILSVYGLSTSTTYYVILESKDPSGNIQRTDQFSVVTTSGL